MYLFNFFDTTNPVWRELGDPEVLSQRNRDYFPDGYWRILAGEDIRDMQRFSTQQSMLCPDMPVTLAHGESYRVIITTTKNDNGNLNISLSLNIDGTLDAGTLAVTLNDNTLENGSVIYDWIRYPVDPPCLLCGANTVQVTNESNSPIILKDIHIGIKHE